MTKAIDDINKTNFIAAVPQQHDHDVSKSELVIVTEQVHYNNHYATNINLHALPPPRNIRRWTLLVGK